MRGLLLIGVLIAMAVVAWLQLDSMKNSTTGTAGAPGETAAEAATRQAEQVEQQLKQAEDKHRKMLEDATR